MEFYGPNAYFLEQYIAFKRNMGYELKNIYTFKMFDRFCIEKGATAVGVTKELAAMWAEKRPNESDVTRYKRVNDIINFSIYLNHLGYQSYIPKQSKAYHRLLHHISSHRKSLILFLPPVIPSKSIGIHLINMCFPLSSA